MAGWLYQIASHISIDRLRQRAQAVQRQVDVPVEDLPIADRNRPSPLTIIQQNEMSECVRRYVTDLTDAYKAVLLLHDCDGLTADEIAHLLQLPLTTVKMRLHRARRPLQSALNSACAFERDERGVFICEPKPDEQVIASAGGLLVPSRSRLCSILNNLVLRRSTATPAPTKAGN